MTNANDNRTSREIWDANAGFWDDYMGDQGNLWHRELVAPAAEKLLELKPDEYVLEIACGAGLFARRMAELGARVLATDFSQVFLERARIRTAEFSDRIELRQLDATDIGELLALGESRFDAAVCNMALMDMTAIEPLFSSLPRLLKPGGRFVFTLSHPCFNTSGTVRMVEEIDLEGDITTNYAIKVLRYKGLKPAHGIGIVGQPRPQMYFDRTLSDLLNSAFRGGLVLDGLEEPIFQSESERPRSLDMRNFKEIPMILAGRMRRATANS